MASDSGNQNPFAGISLNQGVKGERVVRPLPQPDKDGEKPEERELA